MVAWEGWWPREGDTQQRGLERASVTHGTVGSGRAAGWVPRSRVGAMQQGDAAGGGEGPIGGCCIPQCSRQPGDPDLQPGTQYLAASCTHRLGWAVPLGACLHPAPGCSLGHPRGAQRWGPRRVAPLLTPALLSGQMTSLRRRRPSRTASSPCGLPASAPSSTSAPRRSWEGKEGPRESAGCPAFPRHCPELLSSLGQWSWVDGTSLAMMGWCLGQDGCGGERWAAPQSNVGVPSSLDG